MTKARDLADLGNKTSLDEINDAYDAGALSNRNMIINGAMQVAQRGTSFTGTGGGLFCIDRWRFIRNAGTPTLTHTQESDAPDGFSYSYKINVDTPTTLASTHHSELAYSIEAQDMQYLNWGSSAAKDITLSFWVKSNVTGIYSCSFRNQDSGDVNLSKTYTINTSGVWEYKTITIDGDTVNSINNDNGYGLRLHWALSAGSNYTTGTVGVWNSDLTYKFAGHAVDFNGTANNYWQITGVQLEVGDTATPFEHRSYGDELAKCQRYYYRDNISSNDHALSTQSNWNTTHFFGPYYMPVTMRANPTGSYSALSNFTLYQNSQTRTLTSLSFGGSQSLNSRELTSHVSSSITPQGGAGWLRGQGTGWIALDAEL
jgi:hypothetical protein